MNQITQKTETQLSSEQYRDLLSKILSSIKSTRISMARRMNTAVIELYWNIGKSISERKIEEGYGSTLVKRLSTDLKKEFPQMGRSRNILLNFIKADAYGHSVELPKLHNFDKSLPEHIQEQANEILKSRYNLTFLEVRQPLKELELEEKLVDKIKFFILELGKGFSFIGNQYRLTLNDKEYFIEMLFFNRCTRSLVAPVAVADYQFCFPDKEIKQLIIETLNTGTKKKFQITYYKSTY